MEDNILLSYIKLIEKGLTDFQISSIYSKEEILNALLSIIKKHNNNIKIIKKLFSENVEEFKKQNEEQKNLLLKKDNQNLFETLKIVKDYIIALEEELRITKSNSNFLKKQISKMKKILKFLNDDSLNGDFYYHYVIIVLEKILKSYNETFEENEEIAAKRLANIKFLNNFVTNILKENFELSGEEQIINKIKKGDENKPVNLKDAAKQQNDEQNLS